MLVIILALLLFAPPTAIVGQVDSAELFEVHSIDGYASTTSSATLTSHRDLLFTTGKVTGLELLNSLTGQKITDLTNGMVIKLSDISGMTTPSFNIRAVYAKKLGGGSVIFGHNKVSQFSVENSAPFTLCDATASTRCEVLGLGNHTVTATPRARRKGRGRAGSPFTVSFSIVEGAAVASTRDYKPPRLLNFTALTSTKVDVTSQNATVTFQLVIEDDGGFVAGGSLETSFKDVSFQLNSRVFGKPLTATVSVPCSKYLQKGSYPLTVFLYDDRFNGREYGPVDLALQAFPTNIEIVNAGAIDTTKPKVESVVALSSTKVDVTFTEAKINFQITVSDAQSGLSVGYINCQALGLERADFAWPDPIFGKNDVVTATLIVPRFTTPGECTVSAHIADDVGNIIFFSSNSIINVSNSQVEKDPPKLIGLKTLSSATVDVTTSEVEVQYEVKVQDDKSGYVRGAVCVLYSLGLTSCDEFTSIAPNPSNAQTFNISFLIKQFLSPGIYPLALEIADGYGNNAFFNSSALAALSLPSVINVANTVVDTTAPNLVSLVAVSSSTVTVTKAVRVSNLEVKVVVSDSQAGFAEGRLILLDASNAIVQQVVFQQDDPIPGQPVTFNERFRFDQKAKTGSYRLEVNLLDGNGNLATFSTSTLASLGFLNAIQVNGL